MNKRNAFLLSATTMGDGHVIYFLIHFTFKAMMKESMLKIHICMYFADTPTLMLLFLIFLLK